MKASASLENVIESLLLSVEGVDKWSINISEWSLAEIAESRENAVEAGVVLVTDLVLDSFEDLGEEDEIENDGGGEQGVLADVVADKSVLAIQEDGGDVLIHSLFGVSCEGDVLDDDLVVDFGGVGEENLVGGEDIIDAGLLGKFLGLELSLGGEVLAVVVSEVVVADDSLRLDSGGDEEFGEGSFEFGLSGLEVITDDEDFILLGELDNSWDEGILGGSVDVGASFRDGGECEDGGGGDFWVVLFDGLHEVLVGVVDSSLNFTESFSVGSPENDDLVDSVGNLEISDVLSDLVEVGKFVVTREDVVGSGFLVGGDEITIVDGGEGYDFLEVGSEFLLEVVVEDLGAGHGIGHVKSGDIPPVDDDVIGVNKGEDLVQRKVDFLVSVDSDLGG